MLKWIPPKTKTQYLKNKMGMNAPTAIQEHVNLSDFNTMGIAARARYFVSASSEMQLKQALEEHKALNTPLLMLGGGSNLLFVKDFDGLVIHVAIPGIEVIQENEQEVLVKAGAGENWHKLVMHAVEKGWGGIENLSLIPGSVGAAPIQNIGAYGVELEEVFVSLEAIEIKTGNRRTFTHSECRFGYRDSIFKNELKGKYAITHVTLRLQKSPKINTSYKALSAELSNRNIQNPTIKQVSDAVIHIRQSKLPDPAKIGNTGSFFKNPVIEQSRFKKLQKNYPDVPHYPAGDAVKIPAAWLIDQCGWKGKRFGDAGVHKMQALVIVNYGEATGKEIWELAQKIQSSVKQTFGITLMPEVNVVA